MQFGGFSWWLEVTRACSIAWHFSYAVLFIRWSDHYKGGHSTVASDDHLGVGRPVGRPPVTSVHHGGASGTAQAAVLSGAYETLGLDGPNGDGADADLADTSTSRHGPLSGLQVVISAAFMVITCVAVLMGTL